MSRSTRTKAWRQQGWWLAEHYAADTHELRGYPDDDTMRIAVVREHYPETQPSARTAMRAGWRAHRAGIPLAEA